MVRDRISDIIAAEGRTCAIAQMDDAEYRQALLQKLVEEAQEAQQANERDLLTEIADLYEVIDGELNLSNLTESQAKALQGERRIKRGAFQNRTKLLLTE